MSEPQFPDRSAEYLVAKQYDQQQAIEAAQRAADAQAAAEAAQQAQVAYVAPVTVSGNCTTWLGQAGITVTADVMYVINIESGCNPNAVNRSSGACGIGQQLPCGKWPHVWNDPVGALIDMNNYVINSYGSWTNAAFHEKTYNWY